MRYLFLVIALVACGCADNPVGPTQPMRPGPLAGTYVGTAQYSSFDRTMSCPASLSVLQSEATILTPLQLAGDCRSMTIPVGDVILGEDGGFTVRKTEQGACGTVYSTFSGSFGAGGSLSIVYTSNQPKPCTSMVMVTATLVKQ